MPTFDVLSGTWYHITAPDLETAQKVYDAYWEDAALPDGCDIKEGEVDSHWIPVDLEGMDLTLEEYSTILRSSPNKTTLEAMKEALEDETTPEAPSGWKPAW
jgi:hypothetical protein